MFSPFTVIIIFCGYMGMLFLVASWVEHRSLNGKRPADNPIVYSLSMAIYCTSWTFYGSVGQAASSQMLYLTTYIGPTLALILGWIVLRKLVKIKGERRITNIADFISLRYNRSQGLAAMASLVAIVGITPYIALQLKAVTSTFAILTKNSRVSWIGPNVGPLVVLLMIMFTNVFGVRRLDPTERHPGMMVAIALESLVKLTAFLAAGIFVTYFIYDGFNDIFNRVAQSGLLEKMVLQWDGSAYVTWTTYTVLAMSAILFLPRQFHVAVVENYSERHIRTAMWLFPLYLLLINIFVLPVAMGGLLKGFPQQMADSFVLSFPFRYHQKWLSLFIFVGGFSAATSMIMISSMAMSTMVTNHLFLPVAERFRPLGFLRRRVLQCRWAVVAGIIILGYYFEQTIGESYMLVNMGVISFAAVLQFAPAMLGGMFWQRGNQTGAMLGLSAGFATWFYTLFIPAFVKSGWGSMAILVNGPWNLALLRPEHLMGMSSLSPVCQSVFWSLIFNIGLYITGSLFSRQRNDERQVARDFVFILAPEKEPARWTQKEAGIDLSVKIHIIENLLMRYFPPGKARCLTWDTLDRVGLADKQKISIMELANLYADIEKTLSGIIGAATAHMVMKRENLFTAREYDELSSGYAEILADLKVTPEELKEKIDYYQEREAILEQHARELEATVREKEREIDQRRLTEEALKKSEARYRSLLEAAPDPIIVYGVDERVTYINQAFTRIFGWTLSEWAGKSIDAYVPEDLRAEMLIILETIHAEGLLIGFETRRCTKDGNLVDVSISAATFKNDAGQEIGMVVILKDISDRVTAEAEREKLEFRLRQAQKMEAIGTLAGGIAHDFNNILSAIMGFTELSQMKIGENDEVRDYLDKIHQAGNRAKDLIRQILTFSRQREQEAKPIQAGIIAREVLKLLRASLPASIEIQQCIQSRSPIFGDPIQVHQILMNLCTNAGHAMGASGGTLAVSLTDIEVTPIDAVAMPELKPGPYLQICVADTGHGMPPEICERIFDPFFTTKKQGEGTGMGLAVVHGIVKSHDGAIQVHSEPGKGTTFTIILPALKNELEPDNAPHNDLPSGSEHVLWVDDEAILVEIGKQLLETLGYAVTVRTSSMDALELFKHRPDDFDAVITDMTMPKMAGDELARRILELRPGIPIIICTGFSARMTEEKALQMGIRAFIMKPFVVSDLAKTLRRVLDNGGDFVPES
jgi:PAS domain S-box-containing protein